MADFVSSVPVPIVSATGCSVPDFASIYAGIVADFKSVYGQDLVLDNSTQDGQWLGLLATAFKNYSDACLACYNAFSPTTAQGAGLSSVAKINGLTRYASSYSTVDIVNIGQSGRVITNAQIRDAFGNLWLMQDFTIPFSGAITVTAVCSTLGAVSVPPGGQSGQNGFWTIATPQLGWQSVSNPAAASTGSPIETDAQLRIRQTQSTMLPSQTVLEGIIGALEALPNVTRLAAYENDGNAVDANGIPAHAMSFVIDGGDEQAIADVIALKKTPGAGTYGTAVATVIGRSGTARDIRFFRPQVVTITWIVYLRALAGYTLDTETAIRQSLSDWTNALGIGKSVSLARAYVPANLVGNPNASTFELVGLAAARDGTTTTPVDVNILFNEAPFCQPDFVQIIVVSN